MHIRPIPPGLTFHAIVGLVVLWFAAALECLSCLEWTFLNDSVQAETSQCRVKMKALTLSSKAARVFIPFSVGVDTQFGSWVIRHWNTREADMHTPVTMQIGFASHFLQFDRNYI